MNALYSDPIGANRTMSAKEQEILDACENGTFKYAQQQAQKLIKKYPKSTYYQLLNNYVLLQMGKREESIANCQEIMATTPNDPKSIDLLTEMFQSVGMTTEAQQVYENAAKKYPTLETLMSWFHRGCEVADPRVMQKAAMALKKFSSKRIFQIWAAFTCYLASVIEDANMMEKTLFPKLGLKIIDALKPMANEQEVYVLVKLLQLNKEYGRAAEEILAYSKDDKLDLELQIQLLAALDTIEDWDRLYDWSYKILVDYKLDDFDTWKYLIKSGLKSERDVISVIRSFKSRNSQLALVEYKIQSNQDVHDAAFAYLEWSISKPCSFFDMKHYLPHLSKDKIFKWLSELEIPKGEKGLIVDLNIRKFKLLFNRELLNTEEFLDDAVDMFNFYKPLLNNKSKTDFSATSEFILFSVQSLLTINKCSTESLITSVVILENAILKDEHEFHLRLWLIQLYTLLNCHTEAQHHYDKLSIKNVQHDILDQYLVSRCGSVSSSISYLENSFSIYKSNEVETVYFTKLGFNKGAYNKLEKSLEFQKRLDQSYMKKHLALQAVKIGRLLNDKSLISDYKKVKFDKEYDNRDFNIFWNFGIDEPLDIGAQLLNNIPGADHNKIIELIEKLASGEIGSIPEDLDVSSLSEAEVWSYNTLVTVHKFLTGKCKMDVVSKQFSTTPPVPSEATWKLSHNYITLLDTAKCVQMLMVTVGKQKKGLSDVKELNATLLSSLRDDTVLSKRQELKSVMAAHKSSVKASPVLKKLQYTHSVDKIFEIIDRSHLEHFKVLRVL